MRKATLEDIDKLLPFLSEFIMGNGAGIPPKEDSMRAILESLILEDSGVVFVTENEKGMGCIGLLSYPCYYNTDYTITQELFWWAENGTGRELLKAAEGWAKGCLNMLSLEAKNPERVDMIYKRNGFRLLEHTYTKEI